MKDIKTLTRELDDLDDQIRHLNQRRDVLLGEIQQENKRIAGIVAKGNLLTDGWRPLTKVTSSSEGALGQRYTNALKAAGVITISDLAARTYSDLLAIRGLGPDRALDIKTWFMSCGFSLKEEDVAEDSSK